jgi:MFS family permease
MAPAVSESRVTMLRLQARPRRPRQPWSFAPHLDPDVRRNLSYDLGAALGAGLFVALVVNFIGVVARRQGADPLLLAVLTASPFAANTFSVMSGAWIERRRPARFVAIVQGLGRGVFLLVLVSDSPAAIVALAFLFYLSLALSQPMVLEILQMIYPDRMRGRLMGFVRTVQAGVTALAAPLAGVLMDQFGHRALFAAGAGFGLVGSLLYSRIRPAGADRLVRFRPSAAFQVLNDDPLYKRLLTVWLVWGLGNIMAQPLYPLVLVDRLRASYGDVGALNLVLAGAGMAGYLLFGLAVDRRGGAGALSASFALSAAMPFVYAFAPDVHWLAIAFVCAGLSVGSMEIAWPSILMRIAPGELRPRYASLLTTLTGLRGLLAPFIGSLLANLTPLGLTGALLVAGALSASGAALLLFALPPLLERGPARPEPAGAAQAG